MTCFISVSHTLAVLNIPKVPFATEGSLETGASRSRLSLPGVWGLGYATLSWHRQIIWHLGVHQPKTPPEGFLLLGVKVRSEPIGALQLEMTHLMGILLFPSQLPPRPTVPTNSVLLSSTDTPYIEIRASKAVPEEGEEFTLRCIGRGNPEPSVFSWIKFSGDLSERAIPRSENLTFSFLNKSDDGVYRCAASNIIGTAYRNYSLTVHDPLSQLTQSSIDHAVIGGIVAVIVFVALCLLIILIRYLIRHKGTYLTHEAKGSDDAPDADTAIINAEVGHSSSEDKKEYFI
ncbi:cell adhesion molecule 3-like [Carcharodon carcharias]|uniref:cell adhesion molecule 3-like n=1 Tax=Carcharodon carcharias TaxID=13397 RepID=UPI001B7E50F2|nr:cell adhesion molecule 3-like [Carcharodon carcharias]